jgi:hypothetical protein
VAPIALAMTIAPVASKATPNLVVMKAPSSFCRPCYPAQSATTTLDRVVCARQALTWVNARSGGWLRTVMDLTFRGITFPVNIRMPTTSDQAAFRFATWSMIPKSGNRFSEKDHAQTKS